MSRSIRFLEWAIVVGLLVLVVLGAEAAQEGNRERAALLIVTATSTSTPLPPSPTPEMTATLPPTWTPTPVTTPTALPTPTPTATPVPTETPVPGPIALPQPPPVIDGTPVVSSTLPQPTPMPLMPQPAGTINILLLGMDREGGAGYARTDVMMIASVYPDMPAVSLISIPRDYYAWIPTWGLDKINTAFLRGYKQNYPGGGPGLVKATVQYNFGIPIHYYALVDFDSYRSIVDAVGGVDVVVECPFHDTYPDPESPTGQTDIDMEPGVHHLGGKHALWYVRSRWNTSDFDRHRRQQQVLRAVFRKALSQNMIPRIPEFWSVYKEDVETDLGLADMISLGAVGARMDMGNIKSRFIRGTHLVQSWTAPNGGYVLVPQPEALYNFMLEAAQPPVTSRAQQRAYTVHILNGTGNVGWGDVAAYRLDLEGFQVVGLESVAAVPRTTLTDLTTTSKGSPLTALLNLFKLQQGDVVSQPTEGSGVDFQLSLGWNYNPCDATVTGRWSPTATPAPTPSSTP